MYWTSLEGFDFCASFCVSADFAESTENVLSTYDVDFASKEEFCASSFDLVERDDFKNAVEEAFPPAISLIFLYILHESAGTHSYFDKTMWC